MDDAETVVPLGNLRSWALRAIRRAAARTTNIEWPRSTWGMMADAGIADYDVLHVLRTARIKDEPTREGDGSIRAELRQRIQGRGMLVVTCRIRSLERMRVVGAAWERKK